MYCNFYRSEKKNDNEYTNEENKVIKIMIFKLHRHVGMMIMFCVNE